MRPFRQKTAAASVHCYGSKNSLNDKRYNGVFITANAVRIADRPREKRSKIPLSTELIEVCICYNNLVCLDFLSSRDSLLFGNGKRKQYLEFDSTISKTIASLELTVIVVDFLKKFWYWSFGVA